MKALLSNSEVRDCIKEILKDKIVQKLIKESFENDSEPLIAQ